MVGRVRKTPRGILSARQVGATDCAPTNFHNFIPNPSAILSQRDQPILNNLPDQPGLIALVGFNGGVEPFQFFAFHGGSYGD